MDIENVDVKNWKSLIKPTKLDVKILGMGVNTQLLQLLKINFFRIFQS